MLWKTRAQDLIKATWAVIDREARPSKINMKNARHGWGKQVVQFDIFFLEKYL
jgi:hypothetical protein